MKLIDDRMLLRLPQAEEKLFKLTSRLTVH